MKISFSDINSFLLQKNFSKDIDIFRLISLYIEFLEIPSKNNHLSLPPTHNCQEASSKLKEPKEGEYSVQDLLDLFSI